MSDAPLVSLVLAAGGSSRLGTPKQLVSIHGAPLVVHAVRALAGLGPVVVVTGAHAESVAAAVGHLAICVHNARWSEGMGASLRAGVQAVLAAWTEVRGVLVTTCDQPWVTPAHLRALAAGLASHALVASAYGGVLGVPAAFSAILLPELLALGGDRGARDVIRADPARVLALACPEAELDVDRPEDLPRTC